VVFPWALSFLCLRKLWTCEEEKWSIVRLEQKRKETLADEWNNCFFPLMLKFQKNQWDGGNRSTELTAKTSFRFSLVPCLHTSPPPRSTTQALSQPPPLQIVPLFLCPQSFSPVIALHLAAAFHTSPCLLLVLVSPSPSHLLALPRYGWRLTPGCPDETSIGYGATSTGFVMTKGRRWWSTRSPSPYASMCLLSA
jgi:hypothetical protein